MPIIGWVLPGMGGGLLILALSTALCLALSLAFNRQEPRRAQLAGLAIPLIAIAIWAAVRAPDAAEQPRGTPHTVIFTIFLATGILGGIAALAHRAFGAWLYRWWMHAVSPIGWTISHVVMAAAFFAVITPIGLALRLAGKDPLRLRSKGEGTYWIQRPPAPENRRYFRQF